MPFIISPNYVPQDPEWEKHYKPEQQGCAECNGVRVPPRGPSFPHQIRTCNGLKTIQSTQPPNTPPVINREMDKQHLGAITSLNASLIVNRSTRTTSDVDVQTFRIQG